MVYYTILYYTIRCWLLRICASSKGSTVYRNDALLTCTCVHIIYHTSHIIYHIICLYLYHARAGLEVRGESSAGALCSVHSYHSYNICVYIYIYIYIHIYSYIHVDVLCHIIIHTMSHHHAYYVTSSYLTRITTPVNSQAMSHHHAYYATSSCILCHIIIPDADHRSSE